MRHRGTAACERVLIVGCGYLGTALGMRLVGEGHLVWGLRREPHRLPTSIQRVEADVQVPNTLRNLPDVDWVYYLVGQKGGTEEQWRVSALDGLRYLLVAMQAQRLRPRRLIYASTIDVYGSREGDWVDEDSEVSPQTSRAKYALLAERLLQDAKVRSSVIRFGELYGPDRLELVSEVARGRLRGDPQRYLNLIHRDDAAGALLHMIGLNKRALPLYLCVDREPVATLDFVAWVCEQLRTPMPTFDGSASPDVGLRCMSECLADSGYRFRYPTFREGLRIQLQAR